MSIAAFPTEFIAKAEKTTGIIPPTNNMAKTGALKILMPSIPVKVTANEKDVRIKGEFGVDVSALKLAGMMPDPTTGEKINTTEWHNLVVRNKAAEICEKHLSKGDKIYVEGRIKSRQWQAEDGITKYTTEVQVTEFTFLTTKKDTDSGKDSNFDNHNRNAPDVETSF